MSEEAKKKATYDDLYKIPENMVGEIIDGELITSPRPSTKHSRAILSLGDELVSPFQKGRGGPGGWIILVEPELWLNGDVVAPDLAGWKKERLPEPPETNGIEVVPDWICEALSPSTAKIDRTIKMPLYADNKIPYLWFLDPVANTLEIYKLESGRWFLQSTFSDEDKVRAEPFDAIEIDLSVLWWLKK